MAGESIIKRFGRLAFYALLSLWALILFLRFPGINTFERSTFVDMVYGKAYKPYVYRALLPTTVRVITHLIPVESRKSIKQSLSFINKLASDDYPIDKSYLIEYGIAIILMYLSLIGFVFSIRYLFDGIYRAPSIATGILTVSSLIILPGAYGKGPEGYGAIYDFSTLFFFTLGLALMIRAKWLPFLLIFILACINKETTILLTLIFIIHFKEKPDMPSSLFKQLVAAQLVIFVLVKIALAVTFRNNPGSFLEYHHINHNFHNFEPYSVSVIVTWFIMAVAVFYKWEEKPLFLRNCLWILAPLLYLCLIFGDLDETRDYYEVYPIILILVLHTMFSILDIKVTRLDQTETVIKKVA